MPEQPSGNYEQKTLLRTTMLVAVAWTLLVGGSLAWNLSGKRQETIELARKEALANINKDISYRSWVASNGGVYVPVTERTPPNPYLSHLKNRDITTTDGRTLTLMNPSYVTRQVHKLHSENFGIRGKITSLKPLNPNKEVAPSSWTVFPIS